jgi:hypothetical protein
MPSLYSRKDIPGMIKFSTPSSLIISFDVNITFQLNDFDSINDRILEKNTELLLSIIRIDGILSSVRVISSRELIFSISYERIDSPVNRGLSFMRLSTVVLPIHFSHTILIYEEVLFWMSSWSCEMSFVRGYIIKF